MKRECMIGMAMALAVVAWGDVEIGPKDGFAAVRSAAPVTTPVRRLDEVAAARNMVLRYQFA